MKHEDVPGLYSDGEDFGIWEPKRIDGYFILSESILQRVIHPRTQILILGSRENIIRVKRKDRIFLNHQLGNAGLRYYNLSMAIKEYEKLQSSDKVSFLVVN